MSAFKFNENGDESKFNVGFIAVNMLGTGLAMFVALQWQTAFAKLTEVWDESKDEREVRGPAGPRIRRPFFIAVMSTVLAVVVAYLMFKAYGAYKRRFVA